MREGFLEGMSFQSTLCLQPPPPPHTHTALLICLQPTLLTILLNFLLTPQTLFAYSPQTYCLQPPKPVCLQPRQTSNFNNPALKPPLLTTRLCLCNFHPPPKCSKHHCRHEEEHCYYCSIVGECGVQCHIGYHSTSSGCPDGTKE